MRCYRRDSPSYPRYGGRGIAVCDRWQSFENFLADMGRKPSPDHSLDRIDNDGPYSPENCRWSTREEQGHNKRNNLWIEYDGEKISPRDVACRTGLAYATVLQRLHNGWSAAQIITTPAVQGNNQVVRTLRLGRSIEYEGRLTTIAEIAEECGVNLNTFRTRLARGWSVERAADTPVRPPRR